MKFLLAQGIGDCLWALFKVQDIAKKMGDGRVELHVACTRLDLLQTRALEFVRRFSFVDSAQMKIFPSVLKRGEPPAIAQGRWNYIDDWTEVDGCHALMPNAHIEEGKRLETWLPGFEMDWTIADRYSFYQGELLVADELRKRCNGDYCIFCLGAISGNIFDGHNRGMLWRPEDWVTLGRRLCPKHVQHIVVVGAPYDLSYWEHFVKPLLSEEESKRWISTIGDWNISTTFAVVRNARFIVSFQCGIGIFGSYLRVPTAIFWRPYGDSISCEYRVTFSEDEASAWVAPYMLPDKHLPCIYTKHSAEQIACEIIARSW